MSRIVDVRKVQPLSVNSDEKMHDCTVTRELAKVLSPLSNTLWKLLTRSKHLDGVKRSCITYNCLLGFDDITVLESDASGTTILNNDLVNVSI
mmetsp:Transcript_45305/g.130828  ORF Transcript_45305/g.130828 Transcript_45305/m.130828 type:complete len:93 (-) Transcript_45305:1150-1428(-)